VSTEGQESPAERDLVARVAISLRYARMAPADFVTAKQVARELIEDLRMRGVVIQSAAVATEPDNAYDD